MRIGLTQRVLFHKGRAYDSLEHGWYSCLKGHTLVSIPNDVDTDIDVDLLIVTGGDNHPVRDTLEKQLIQKIPLISGNKIAMFKQSKSNKLYFNHKITKIK